MCWIIVLGVLGPRMIGDDRITNTPHQNCLCGTMILSLWSSIVALVVVACVVLLVGLGMQCWG